jgi:hypothetical protein
MPRGGITGCLRPIHGPFGALEVEAGEDQAHGSSRPHLPSEAKVA